ncbi:hypothetical protein [Deinococcus arenicola]|uniref:LamG domain-containing protein n=1 Tax=Deinococcus arenicola TaxID=2994950 RepID=A0ABU4DUB6_9DEIO|nr:hypothetical protein [Deinococcus sp. ZS9-10]MDV6376029.1 hypothetical protein [Deinococcus sp. ZS9-10]
MKVEFRGMGSYQGSPVAGSYAGGQLTGSYLVINYLARLEDGDGDASVAQYFLIYNPGTDSWRDAHNPGLPLLIPVTLDLRVRVEITEVFAYSDRPEVRTVFGGWATATNLAGTQLDYTQLQPIPGVPGQAPLTMQAARELLTQGGVLLPGLAQGNADVADALADLAQAKLSVVTDLHIETVAGQDYLVWTAPAPLTPPVNLAAKVTGKGARLSWTAGDVNATSHRVETATGGGAFTTAATIAMPALSADLVIPVNEARTARVIAVDAIGDSKPAPTPPLSLPARYPAGALALWTLEEGTGTVSSDLVNSRALTLSAANSKTPSWEAGGGVSLNGGGFLDAGMFGEIPAGGLQLIVVVKFPTYASGDANTQPIFARWTGEYVLNMDQSKSDNTGKLSMLSKAPDGSLTSTQSLPAKTLQDNNWHIIRAVFTPTRQELWVDGALQAGVTVTAGKIPPTPTVIPLVFGKYSTAAAAFVPRWAYNAAMLYPGAELDAAALSQIHGTEKLRLTQVGRTAAW